MCLTALKTKRLIEITQCFIVFVMTPTYFLFQLCIMRPFISDHLRWGALKHFCHILAGCYLFTNVAGNMILCVLTDSRVKAYRGPGNYCEQCKQKQPADSWHCKICNACILRRDHHCTFLAHCIGRTNLRYFTCYFCHLAISILYATYYNYIVLKCVFDLRSFAETTSKLFNLRDWSVFSQNAWVFRKRMFVFFWFLNLVILPFAINLALFHLYKAFRGLTWYEYKKGKIPVKIHWMRNMAYVFGTRWYLALLWPSVKSPLPHRRKRELRAECKNLIDS